MNYFRINLFYYTLFLICLLATTLCNLTITSNITGAKLFFYVYGILQTLIETVFIIIAAEWIKKSVPKLFYPFIGLTFIVLLAHLIDFILIRIMDLTIWNALNLILDETFANFLEILYSTGVPLIGWIGAALLICLLPIIGMIIHKLTSRYCISINKEKMALFSFLLPSALFLWDLSIYPVISQDVYIAYNKALPWKTTFLQKEYNSVNVSFPLIKPKEESYYLHAINEKKEAQKRPNIFLFVIETLREDYLTEKTAPNLWHFKQENVSFLHSIANANATHISWFSIFHSLNPYSWAHVKNAKWQSGSIPLNILKNCGYEIHTYASSQLCYYNMSEVIFGKNSHLTNFHSFPHYNKEASEADLMAIAEFQKKPFSQNGNLFIFFLDSTHFDYSYPKEFGQFQPASGSIGLFKVFPSKKDLILMKNRYKNAINYIDFLVGKFIQDLKAKNLYDNSLIVFTADHGEEFFEEGHLFHASHLSAMQTLVPIYYKFPEKIIPKTTSISSHIDIFPTILDYLFNYKSPYEQLLDGKSIFNPNENHSVVTARFNASRSPDELFLHDGEKKFTIRLNNTKDIFSSNKIQLLSIHDEKDALVDTSKSRESMQNFSKLLQKILAFQ